jgi:hypothetical protein
MEPISVTLCKKYLLRMRKLERDYCDQHCQSCIGQLKNFILQMMIWISYLDSSHFSDQFRYIIYRNMIYGFVNMDYSILNGKKKIN